MRTFLAGASVLLASCSLVGASCQGPHEEGAAPGFSGASDASSLDLYELPSCRPGEPVLTYSPIALGDLLSVGPLGHVAPPPHTFPSDHMYFLHRPGEVVPVVSPADLVVVSVASQEILSADPPATDYVLRLRPCREFQLTFGHVKTLSHAFAAKLGPVDLSHCMTYRSGAATARQCSMDTHIALVAGELIGTAGVDVGAMDARVSPLDYANAARYSPAADGVDVRHTVCPLEYFAPTLREQLRARVVGTSSAGNQPTCGAVMQDVAGTAQGRWFVKGSGSDPPEDHQLALVYDNDHGTPYQVFSVGMSTGGSGLSAGVYYFAPASSGKVNRGFEGVTADGSIYCYDGFVAFDSGQAIPQVVLVQLDSPTTLRIEKLPGAACSALSPWAFDGNATDFER